MARQDNGLNRRDFLRQATTAGLASMVASGPAWAEAPDSQKGTPGKATSTEPAQPKAPQVPRRVLGKTGVEVPILNLGGMFDIPNNQVLMQRAINWGVTYWDTAYGYMNGNSELGIGMYLQRMPKMRKDLFIVTKASGARTVADMDERFKTSLERLKTDYIDLYYIHGMNNPDKLTDEVKAWAEKQKKANRLRFFGFSTHKNMADCLNAAAKLDWIDVIMTSFNFRLMQDDKLQKAVDACHKNKIGLVAMKTQGGGPIDPSQEQDQKLAGHFLKQGYSEHQAKLKAVWQDERFATICSQMPNLAILVANVAAALDKTKLSADDMRQLRQYAQATSNTYCQACGMCDQALPDTPCVSEVMRHMMYYRNYGDLPRARAEFAQIPGDVRGKLLRADFVAAERACPRRLPIAQVVADAFGVLA